MRAPCCTGAGNGCFIMAFNHSVKLAFFRGVSQGIQRDCGVVEFFSLLPSARAGTINLASVPGRWSAPLLPFSSKQGDPCIPHLLPPKNCPASCRMLR